MNKAEAISAMVIDGSKVTHKYFTDDEWMTMKLGRIHFEDGCICEPERFWSTRTDIMWEDDWSILSLPTG